MSYVFVLINTVSTVVNVKKKYSAKQNENSADGFN